ncbi:MAG: 30S ribosomal protein S4, partial [Chlamydiales bacterium]
LYKEDFKGKLVVAPELDQIEGQLPIPINIPVVCEFLSHSN